ncbi:polyribonucleotide nucleotidyltransferase [Candidatus Hydrogenedentota bacterium]
MAEWKETKVTASVGGNDIIIETGKMAKQAHGSVTVTYGETMVLVSVVGESKPRPGLDFFPLMVDFREKSYAAGKIPGNFFRREGRPGEGEILSCRLIDRPIRPLFPKGYRNEVQVQIIVLSADEDNVPDVLALVGASAALSISDIPFSGPIGGVRVGYINGEYVANPTIAQMAESELDLIVAGTEEAITMVEAGAKEVSEDVMLGALAFAHEQLKKTIVAQKELVSQTGQPKREIILPEEDAELVEVIKARTEGRFDAIFAIGDKDARKEAASALLDEIMEGLGEDFEERAGEVKGIFGDIEKKYMRQMVVEDGKRVDGRSTTEIRKITCEVGLLPRAHGSALFTRGQTQALVAATLGTSRDEQRLDELQGTEDTKSFMLHYNFPSFSVGECRPIRGPGRREIGHGALAERALRPVVPMDDPEFPYTLRIVSDILESNGSSSMASVCGATLSLLDAGVPISAPVAGIAMGLIMEDGKYAILSDILGLEDHLGDMDFKVTGTAKGVTALQMDIKISGVTIAIMTEALKQAQEGRMYILDKMNTALAQPREEMSQYAPRIFTVQVAVDKIGSVIGPGGKVVRELQAQTNTVIAIEDDGTIKVAASNNDNAQMAIQMINDIVADVEPGKVYDGTVMRLMDFGAFVEVLPGKEGLVHISEISNERVESVASVLSVGDAVRVKCHEVDRMGRVNLTIKGVDIEGYKPAKRERPSGGGRDRGGRDRGGRDRGGRR